MKTTRAVPVGLICAAVALASCSRAEAVPTGAAADEARVSASSAGQGNNMVLNLRGSAVGESRTMTINGTAREANCFTVDLFDLSTDRAVGKATDCLVIEGKEPNGGLRVIGTTIFDFGNGHTFTSRGLTTVQPTLHGSPDFTHITGAVPPEGENSVIAATGRFKNLTARVRLSGAVNMSQVESENRIAFDCIFVVHPR
ncbi:MAG TPA: hypothetical protein VGR37_19340 [Longimicrobiaceae bacterium]|nr:hypothetical protein [Longimicrobiaceae bacterium]